MNEHDDLVARLAGAARQPVDPMPADAVDRLEQRLLAVADDDRTITPVVPLPNRRRRSVLVTAAAIGTAAAAVAIAVAVTGSPDRSLTPAGSGSQQTTDTPATTPDTSAPPDTSAAPSSSTSPSPPASTSIAPGTSIGAVPGTDESPGSAPPASQPSTTTPTPTPTTGSRPAPTTVVSPTSGPTITTTTSPAPSTTAARQPLPAPTLTLSASRSGGMITLTWTRVNPDGFGQYVLARVPADGISTWPSGMARVVARLRLAARGTYTVDATPGEERSFVVIALSSDQRVIAVSNVLTVPG